MLLVRVGASRLGMRYYGDNAVVWVGQIGVRETRIIHLVQHFHMLARSYSARRPKRADRK